MILTRILPFIIRLELAFSPFLSSSRVFVLYFLLFSFLFFSFFELVGRIWLCWSEVLIIDLEMQRPRGLKAMGNMESDSEWTSGEDKEALWIPWLLIITINLEIFFWFVLWGLDRIGIWKWCKREMIIVGGKEKEAGIDRATKLSSVDLGNSKNESLPLITP